jgi:hypothetical protein
MIRPFYYLEPSFKNPPVYLVVQLYAKIGIQTCIKQALIYYNQALPHPCKYEMLFYVYVLPWYWVYPTIMHEPFVG